MIQVCNIQTWLPASSGLLPFLGHPVVSDHEIPFQVVKRDSKVDFKTYIYI